MTRAGSSGAPSSRTSAGEGRATTGAPAKEGVAGVKVSRGVAEGVRAMAGSRAKQRASLSAGGVVIRTPGEGGGVKAQAEVKGLLSVKGTKVSGGGAEVKGVNPGAATRAAVPPLSRNRGAAVVGTSGAMTAMEAKTTTTATTRVGKAQAGEDGAA